MLFRGTYIKFRGILLREIGFLRGRFRLPRSLFSQVRKNTMASIWRLDNAYRLAEEVEAQGLAGDIVECGVWKGGCVGVMAAVVKAHGYRRQIHLLDSFEGLPQPTREDGPMAHDYSRGRTEGRLVSIGKCVGQLGEAEDLLFKTLQIDRSKVVFHVGWFQEILPRIHDRIGPIALLRLDGDWYESTRVCLEYLYPHVVPGGYVILDDYGHWEGCRKAFHEYLEKQGIPDFPLVKVDYTGVYFRKD